MRVGQNPNKQVTAGQLTPIVLSCVTHLPNERGYHAKRMEVIQTCLTSMRKNAGGNYSVIVWDNGSDDVLLDWLRYDYKPDILIQSINIGLTQAKRAIANMLPRKSIMAYADDDILFLRDWLAPQVEILQHFPNVSAVTGYPVRTSFRWGNSGTLSWGRRCGKMATGKFIPREWERDFAISIGRNPDDHETMTANDFDTIIEYKGRQAYATSHHCQFVGYAGRIADCIMETSSAMNEERSFDEALDRKGLRLATIERKTRHIGNIIHDDLQGAVKEAMK